MQFETLETLLLILFFSFPGAIFVYSYSRSFNPTERTSYIQEQFPLETTILYLIASVFVHILLIILTLVILNIIAVKTNNPNLLQDITSTFGRNQFTEIRIINSLISSVVIYFVASILLSYFLGRLWARWNYLALPLWCQQIVKIQAAAYKNGEVPTVELMLRNGSKLMGKWHSVQLIDRKKVTFEISILQDKKNLVIWTQSSNILSMDLRAKYSNMTLYFGEAQDEEK